MNRELLKQDAEKLFRDQSVTIGKSENVVTLQCDTSDDAISLFNWLWNLQDEPDDEPDTRTSRQKAEAIVSWLADQRYQDEPLMHAIVCCDYASQQHLTDAIARLIEDGTVYCHECSKAGGANRGVFHLPPVCK